MTDDSGFFEVDQPVEKVLAAYDRGVKGVTAPPAGEAQQAFNARVAENLASLNEIIAEIVTGLAEGSTPDQGFAAVTRHALRDHTWSLGFQFKGQPPPPPSPEQDEGLRLTPGERDQVEQALEDDGPEYLGYDQAAAMLPDGDRVHTLVQSVGGMLFGADWDRDAVLALLRSGNPEATGPAAASMGHGLCARDATGQVVFIETRKADDG